MAWLIGRCHQRFSIQRIFRCLFSPGGWRHVRLRNRILPGKAGTDAGAILVAPAWVAACRSDAARGAGLGHCGLGRAGGTPCPRAGCRGGRRDRRRPACRRLPAGAGFSRWPGGILAPHRARATCLTGGGAEQDHGGGCRPSHSSATSPMVLRSPFRIQAMKSRSKRKLAPHWASMKRRTFRVLR